MGILQGLIYCFVIIFTKAYCSKTNSFLVLTVLSLSFSNLQYWILDSNLITSKSLFGILRVPCEFLILPSFYIFINLYIEHEVLKRQKILLYTPFTIDFLFQILNSINAALFNDKLISRRIVYSYLVIEEISSLLFSFLLIILTIRLVNRYEKENSYLNLKTVIAKTKWIKQILFIGLTICCFWVIQLYFMMNKNNTGMSIYYPIWICISFIIYWLSYAGIFHSSVLSQRKNIREKLLNTDEINQKNNTHRKKIKEFPNDKIFYEFEKFIKISYLKADLSLDDVAKELGISSNYLSQVINSKNIKFNDYLNTLRIEKVKKILKDEAFLSYTITSIGLESGFNSNASFYRAFKKHTGISPLDYRNS